MSQFEKNMIKRKNVYTWENLLKLYFKIAYTYDDKW